MRRSGWAAEALAGVGLVLLGQWQVARVGSVFSPVRVHVCPVQVQAALGVEGLVGAPGADPPVVHVEVMAVVVVVVTMVVVLVGVSVCRLEQPAVLGPLLELGQFVRGDAARLLLQPPFMGLGKRWDAAAVLEAGLGLGAPLLGEVQESVGATLLDGRLADAQVRRTDSHALAAVDRAGREDGGDDGPQALPGPGRSDGFRVWVGDLDAPDRVAPEVIGLGFDFGLGLSTGRMTRGKLLFVKYAKQRQSPLLAVVPALELAVYQLLLEKLEDSFLAVPFWGHHSKLIYLFSLTGFYFRCESRRPCGVTWPEQNSAP